MTRKYAELCLSIEQVENELSELKREKQELLVSKLPEVLDELGLSSAQTDDGKRITLETEVSASIQDNEKFFAYLETLGETQIIKDVVELAKGGFDQELADFLDSHGKSFDRKATVHPQTLKKWVRDRISEGLEIPDSLKVSILRIAKIKE